MKLSQGKLGLPQRIQMNAYFTPAFLCILHSLNRLFYIQRQDRIIHTDPYYRSVPHGLPGRRALNNTKALLRHQLELTADTY